ncbi:hypothetical protein Pelo_6694 [Pelomyxa schiedti]|nr:hypothetical protein Pelo_6694 [Pelomyxa schiedti]
MGNWRSSARAPAPSAAEVKEEASAETPATTASDSRHGEADGDDGRGDAIVVVDNKRLSLTEVIGVLWGSVVPYLLKHCKRRSLIPLNVEIVMTVAESIPLILKPVSKLAISATHDICFVLECSAAAGTPQAFNFVAQQMSPQLLECTLGSAFVKSCQRGHLSLSRSIAAMGSIPAEKSENALLQASGEGHIDVVEWLLECNGNKNVDEVFMKSCSHGHLPLAKWVLLKFGKENFRSKRDVLSSARGPYEVVIWLVETFSVRPDFYALKWNCSDGNLPVVQYYCRNFPFEASNIEIAWCECQRNGHFTLANWMASQYPDTLAKPELQVGADSLFMGGSLDIVYSMVVENNAEWFPPNPSYCLRRSCVEGKARLAEHIISQFSPTTEQVRSDNNMTLLSTCAAGELETLILLVREFGLTREDVCTKDNYAFYHACRNGHVAVAKWLQKQFGVIEVTESHHYMMLAVGRGNWQVAEWILKCFGPCALEPCTHQHTCRCGPLGSLYRGNLGVEKDNHKMTRLPMVCWLTEHNVIHRDNAPDWVQHCQKSGNQVTSLWLSHKFPIPAPTGDHT